MSSDSGRSAFDAVCPAKGGSTMCCLKAGDFELNAVDGCFRFDHSVAVGSVLCYYRKRSARLGADL